MCERDSPAVCREIAAYHHLDKIVTSKPGALLKRDLLDAFKVTGRASDYQGLVHEPLGMCVEKLGSFAQGKNILQAFSNRCCIIYF